MFDLRNTVEIWWFSGTSLLGKMRRKFGVQRFLLIGAAMDRFGDMSSGVMRCIQSRRGLANESLHSLVALKKEMDASASMDESRVC
ncbi:unnamed protein product [Microthlaspi erraticum]|uniref:Uncharacterized protein n=1 Tax=Microthlaspi erraticum TaxID=1685480 RepID=A0A6D2KPP1_9BRAS|nr:unnamed protein product [Microthlaspi erraticum]